MDKKSLSERTAGEGQNIDELWVWQPLYDNNAVRENIILFIFIRYSFYFYFFLLLVLLGLQTAIS